MKKLKLLPSVLMMIMCVGVLAVGVFAISPIVSTIGGTLSISAAKGVKVAVYNSESMSANSLVDSAFGGASTEVDLGLVSLDSSTASSASDVTPKVFYIKLTTNQDKNYVVDTETIEYINGVGVTSGEIIKNAGLVTKMHTYTATDSKGRACFNKTNPYQIKLSIRCGALSTEVVNMAFDLALNIYEENDTSFTDTEINGVDYLYFGTYPQSLESSTLTGYTSTGETYVTSFSADYEPTNDSILPVYKQDGDILDDRFVYVPYCGLYKIEPIKWDILKQGAFFDSEGESITKGNTLIVSDLMLDSTTFTVDESTNLYEGSELRSNLNSIFLLQAFTQIEKELIKITSVQNDISTNITSDNLIVKGCDDTDDYVFALSYQDVTNSDYGYNDNNSRQKDYSKFIIDCLNYYSATGDIGGWALRSAAWMGSAYIITVNDFGGFVFGHPGFSMSGLVPAMHISL